MATVEAPRAGDRPFDEFDGVVRRLAPRRAARRDPRVPRSGSASASRRRRTASGRCKTVDLASAAYPVSFAFHGAAKGINPYINIINRLVIVQFEDFEGNLSTLAWEPTIAEGAAEAPFYDQLLKRYGEFLSYKVFATFYNTVEEAVAVRHHARRRRLRQLRPPARAGPAPHDGHHEADQRRARAAQAVLPERQVPVPAQGGRHLRLHAPDAVGLVRAGRDGRRDRGQPGAARRRRRARQGRRDRGHARATRTATTASP